MNLINAATPPPVSANVVEILRNGEQVAIRPIRRGDAAAERAFICALSAESRRMRFLGQFGTPSDATIERLTTIDPAREAAFVAKATDVDNAPIVGVARYGLEPKGGRAECAVVVTDDWQDNGLGTRLMQRLIDTARTRGVGVLYSIDAAENHAMAELAQHLGFSRRIDPDDHTQVIHELSLARSAPRDVS